MKRSKHQAPNTREAPTGKHQIPSSKLQKKSKHQTPGSRYTAWAFSADARDDAFVLREESPAAPNDHHPFDLEERTAVFGEKICLHVPQMNLFQMGLTNAMRTWLQPLRNVPSQVDVWSLELIWSLELGVWCFVVGFWCLVF
jgi:hypothetical protein